ncbi:ribonuclease H-like domain-containing protein [Tanacetum coccineum]
MTMCVYLISSLTTLHKPKVLCKADYYANQLSLLRDLVDIEESNTDEVLGRQWDRVNAVFLGWILNSVSEELFLVLDDSYTQIRSSILSREVLHDVRSAYATISSEESQEVASGSIVGSSQRNQPSIFVSNVPNSKVIVNRKIVDSGASQHMTNTDRELDHVYNISHLKIKVGHPNGIKAFISKIRNLKLPNGLVQFDVMDLNLKKVMGIGNQCGGLYHFNDKGLVTLQIQYDYTRVVWVYLVKSKDEVAFDISIFYNLIENQFKRKIKVRSDNGTEIVNQTVNKFCNDKGIVHQTFCTYTPQQNGIAERKHRHLLNVVRSLLFHERIPLKMWTECILTATYLINRLPYSVLIRKSPYEIIYKKPPTLSHLRVFGYLCFATVVNNHAKFGSRDVKFFESVFPFKDSASKEKELDTSNVFQDLNHINFFNNEYPEIPYDDERVDPNLNSEQRSQSDSSHSSVPGRDMNIVTTLEENISSGGNLDQNPSVFVQGTQNLRRSSRQSVFPKNYNGFVVDSKVNYGLESEMDALLRNDTWDIVDLPKDRKPSSWPVFQLDVNNAFLYGDLIKTSGNGIFLALLVYVDDIIITGNNVYEIEKFKVYLKSKFMIKGLGKLKYFLSIEVIDTDKGICLNQRKYVLDLLSEYDMLACKPTKTPLMSKLSISNKATDNDPTLDNITDYQKLMGKLIYLTNTRPDISYDVHCLGIHIIKNSSMNLKAFSDADWAKCVVSRKLVIGYCVFLNNSLVSWKSTKQNTLSKSLMETEYRTLASVTSEVIWILKTLKDLKIDDRLPVFLYCDINSAIKIVANLVFMKEQKTWKLIYTL